MSVLTEPQVMIEHLRDAGKALSAAHQWAGEQEGDRSDLIGPVRDLIFGLNSSIDALVQMIEEGRFGWEPLRVDEPEDRVVDLMAVLEESVAAAKARKATK